MARADELRAIYNQLRSELGKAEGSGAASIARELRLLVPEIDGLDVEDLQDIYEQLRLQLDEAEGSGAAAIARELRLLGADLDALVPDGEETPRVDEVAERRARSNVARPPARRRKSG